MSSVDLYADQDTGMHKSKYNTVTSQCQDAVIRCAAYSVILNRIPIIDPRSTFKKIANVLLLLVLLFEVIQTPLVFSFEFVIPSWLWILNFVNDLILFIDVVLNFRVGYYQDGILRTDPEQIAKHYMFDEYGFTVDLLSAFPLSLCGTSTPVLIMRMILKYTRIWEIFNLIKRFDPSGGTVTKMCHIMHGLVTLSLCAHLSACAWNLIAILDRSGSQRDMSWENNGFCPDDCDAYERWRTGTYFALVTLSSVGYGDVTPKTNLEAIYSMILILCGGIIYGYVLSIAMATFAPAAHDVEREEKMQELLGFLKTSSLPHHVKRHVVAYYEYHWSHGHAVIEKRILDGLPPVLRNVCTVHIYKELIEGIPFLNVLGEECVSELVTRFTPMHVAAGNYVFNKGSVGKSLFILKDGQVEVLREDQHILSAKTGDLTPQSPDLHENHRILLGPGDMFGESALATNSAPRNASVRATLASFLLCLDKADFYDVEKMYPELNLAIKQMQDSKSASKAEENLKKLKRGMFRANMIRRWAGNARATAAVTPTAVDKAEMEKKDQSDQDTLGMFMRRSGHIDTPQFLAFEVTPLARKRERFQFARKGAQSTRHLGAAVQAKALMLRSRTFKKPRTQRYAGGILGRKKAAASTPAVPLSLSATPPPEASSLQARAAASASASSPGDPLPPIKLKHEAPPSIEKLYSDTRPPPQPSKTEEEDEPGLASSNTSPELETTTKTKDEEHEHEHEHNAIESGNETDSGGGGGGSTEKQLERLLRDHQTERESEEEAWRLQKAAKQQDCSSEIEELQAEINRSYENIERCEALLHELLAAQDGQNAEEGKERAQQRELRERARARQIATLCARK